MIILTGSRASGKTYNLFANCEAQGIPIIVGSCKKERELKSYIKRLGFNVNILHVSSADFILNYHPKIAIDNIEEFLNDILGKHNIEIVTALGTVVDLSKNRRKDND